MATLRALDTGQSLGTLSDPDARLLRRNLESAFSSQKAYYIDAPTLGVLTEEGLTPGAVAILREALEKSDGVTVTIDSDEFDEADDVGSEETEDAIVAGQPLVCVVCRSGHFRHRKAQLHSALASFVNLEWLGPTADCYICENCGYVHWFIQPR